MPHGADMLAAMPRCLMICYAFSRGALFERRRRHELRHARFSRERAATLASRVFVTARMMPRKRRRVLPTRLMIATFFGASLFFADAALPRCRACRAAAAFMI